MAGRMTTLSQPCRTRAGVLHTRKSGWHAFLTLRVRSSSVAIASNSATLGIRIDGPGAEPCDLRIEIASGKARVTQGNNNDLPTVSVDGPSFASLFTGFRSASKLARQGVLFGEADAVQLCDLVFAGPLPWVAEHF